MESDMKLTLKESTIDSGVKKDFFDAVIRYDFNRLKFLLESGSIPDVNKLRDDRGRSALHLLLQDGFMGHLKEAKMLECLQLLIRYKCGVNTKDDESGEYPLSLALFNGFESSAMLLVKNGADTSVRTPKYSGAHRLSTAIALSMPEVMIEIFNQGVHLIYENGGIESAKPMVKLDWGPVVQYSEDPVGLVKYGIRKRKYAQRETSFLYSLLDVRSYEILDLYMSHPLVSAFLHLKGRIITSKLRVFQMVLFLYPILYMIFIYFLYFDICKFRGEMNDDDKEATTDAPDGSDKFSQKCAISLGPSIAALLLAVVVFGFACVEVYMQLRIDTKYLRSWRTWVIRVTLVIMGCTLWPALTFKDVYNISWQYPIAAMGTFFAWVMFLIQMELVPQVKVYLEMLVSIILSVLKIIILFLPLLIGFYMGFNLMFFETGNIMNFILMSVDVGSDEYEEMIDSAKDSRAWFTAIAYIFTVVFIIVIAIVFMNFLLGVSIDDIQKLKNKASIMTSSNRVQNYFIIDLFLPTSYQVTDRGKTEYFTFDPAEKVSKLPASIRTKITLLLKEKYAAKMSQQSLSDTDSDNLARRIDQLESKVNTMMDLVHEKNS